MKNSLNVRAVNPKTLSETDFIRLNEVTQDLWAHGIWELVQCNHCQKMHSKQDIFWHLAKDLYDETVQKIMNVLEIDEIACPNCSWDTHFIYPKSHVENIKERLLQSQESFLVVCENEREEIVGYEEWYIDSMDAIFQRELAYHYKDIGIDEIKHRIAHILWYSPENMFVLSSIGILNKYVSFFTLFDILKHFSIAIPEAYAHLDAITELDKKNNLNMVSEAIGCKSLWIHDDPILKTKITNTGNGYESNLTIVPEAGNRYKHFFSKGPKHFLKLSRSL